jgi:hypothetical protein
MSISRDTVRRQMRRPAAGRVIHAEVPLDGADDDLGAV